MPNGAGLTRDSPAQHGRLDIELSCCINDFQRLANQHLESLPTEVFARRTVIDNNVALARRQPDLGRSVLSMARGVMSNELCQSGISS